MTLPLISIISPFRGSVILKYFLQSLQQQSIDPTTFEVLIVEDGDYGARKMIGLFNTRYDLRLVPFERSDDFSGHSAALCRNAGAHAALGEYLVFIDSDCILHPRCIEEHLSSLKDSKQMAICGYASELPASQWGLIGRGFYESYEELEAVAKVDARESYEDLRSADWHHWYTCNAAVRKALFFEAGCFDESGFRCHDMELAYRLSKLGCGFRYERKARVIHVEHPRSLKSRTEQRQGWSLLAAKHPELEVYVFDRLLESQRYQMEIAEYCEERFLQLTSELRGVRIGSSWVTSLGLSIDAVNDRLRDIPHTTIQERESIRIQLGLHRNCWDYEILLPQISHTQHPAVSVLIPFFNAGENVVKAVGSVFLQTVQNFEVILIDDGSNDDTTVYLEAFIRDPRVRLLSCPENLGLSSALNVGLTHSNATIVVHLDSDDWLEPSALFEICATFNEGPAVAAVYANVFLHVNDQVIVERGSRIQSYEGYFSYECHQAPRAYRKESLLAIGGWSVTDAYNGRFYEDRLTLATLSGHYEVRWINKHLYNCRENPLSLSRSDPLLAASAKLSILYDQANKHKYDLAYHFDGGLLEGFLCPRLSPKSPYQWSIIVPFNGDAHLLRLSIRSWLESDFMETEGEIIIVDDASGADLQPIIDLAPEKIKVIQNGSSLGPATARNLGVAVAQYEMLFFSDADHIVPPDVLGKHSKRHLETSGEALVVGGVFGRRAFTNVSPKMQVRHKEKLLTILKYRELFEIVARSFLLEKVVQLVDVELGSSIWNTVERFSFTEYWLSCWGEIILTYGEDLDGFEHRWTRLGTGSLSMQKKSFVSLGGFDERLKSMEDWELGIRVQQTGLRIVCAPEAEPFHQVHPVDGNRNTNNEEAVRYIHSLHTVFVEGLITDKSYFVPPARFFFAPSAKPQHSEQGSGELSASKDRSQELSANDFLLTFDDGPHPLGTLTILDVLNKHQAKGLFFLLGYQVMQYPDIVRMITKYGHEIGVHSWTHADSVRFTTAEMIRMLSDTVELIYETIGKTPKYSRPPYGKLSPSYYGACQELGLTPLGWTTSSEDWAANSAKDIIINLASRGVKREVLLFHDGTGSPEYTAEALDWLLTVCTSVNLRAVSVDEFGLKNDLPHLDICNPFA